MVGLQTRAGNLVLECVLVYDNTVAECNSMQGEQYIQSYTVQLHSH